MIDDNILKNFISNFDREASFSVIITDIKQEEKCNKDIVTLKTQYINPNLFTIIKNQSNLIDDIKNASNYTDVQNILNTYNHNATKISQVINRDLVLQSELTFNNKDNLFITKLKGYQNNLETSDTYKTNLEGTIKNGVIKITSPDFPSKITFNDIRVVNDQIKIKIKEEINNIELYIDNEIQNGNIENNVFIANINNIQSGSHKFNINYNVNDELITKNIEIAVTNIDKEIEITFAKEYLEIPCLYVTIDGNYNNLYSGYITNFKKKYLYTDSHNESSTYIGYSPINEMGDNYEVIGYQGVKLKFQNLKRKSSYPKINITIIGGYYNEPNSD